MKYFIYFSFFTLVFSQEFEVDGDLRVQGEVIFSDESIMSSASSGIPAGILSPFAGNTAPEGWLLCDGSVISRATYSNLFSVISEIYGSGDGSTTFAIPDLRGRMAMGLDNMGGTSTDRVTNVEADNMGGNAGTEVHQLTVDELASHNHYLQNQSGSNGWDKVGIGGAGQLGTGLNTAYTGDNQPHNNMPPYMALNYIIKF